MGLSFFSSVSILSVIKKRRKCYEVTVPFWGFSFFHESFNQNIEHFFWNKLPSPLGVFIFFMELFLDICLHLAVQSYRPLLGFLSLRGHIICFLRLKVTVPLWGFTYKLWNQKNLLNPKNLYYRPLLGFLIQRINTTQITMQNFRPLLGFFFFFIIKF